MMENQNKWRKKLELVVKKIEDDYIEDEKDLLESLETIAGEIQESMEDDWDYE
jgi:hypothetical protein